MRTSVRTGWMAVCAAISLACGRQASSAGDGTQSPIAARIEVSIGPASLTIERGGTARFRATVTGASDTAVSWSTDGGTIDQDGFYTAPDAPGTFNVTATSRADPSRSATAAVSVSSISVALAPQAIMLARGGIQQFTAVVTGAADTRVSWTVMEGSRGGSIDGTGAYTAPPAAGTFHVVATSAADPGRTATAVVTVTRLSGVSVSIIPGTATVLPGAATRFAAAVAGATDSRVIWTCDGGRIRQDGVYTAPQTEGAYRVTAQSLADPEQFAIAAVQVAATSQSAPVEPESVAVETGDLVVFRAHLAGTAQADVAWSILEGDAGGTIDALGQYIAPTGHEGVYHVVATSRIDPSKTGVATVTVQRFDLVDHGGTVVASTRTFLLWWGDENAFPPDARTALESLLQGLNGSAWLALADEYLRGAHATTFFAGSLFDASAPPSEVPTEPAIADQACRALDDNGIVPAPGDMVFVVSSVFPAGKVPFCAWHHWGLCHGQSLLVAYLPNPRDAACARPASGCNAFSADATALGAFAAHEFMEAITDPFITAWRDALGQEVADKCFGLAACVPLTTGVLQLQPLYSNAAHACVHR